MRLSKRTSALLAPLAVASALVFATSASCAAPQYTIVDLGVIGTLGADEVSQAMRISPTGMVVGRSFTVAGGATAFSWSEGGSITALPKLAGKPSAVANGTNGQGSIVGTASNTVSGLAPLAVMWQNGQISQLASGYTTSRANDVNTSNTIVGSVGGGTNERAAVFGTNGSTTMIPLLANGAKMTTAFSINDAGLAVGAGYDPNNAALNLGLVYDTVNGSFINLGGVAGKNGSIAYDVSNAGHVVGASMQNQGSGVPFIWTAATGMVEIPLLPGTSNGGAQGVNSMGWAVGSAGGQYSNPFLWADNTLYSIASLVPSDSGWNFTTNTTSSAIGIAEDGTIVGTSVLNGVAHAYAMVLVSAVPEPGSYALLIAGLGLVGAVARRRSNSKA